LQNGELAQDGRGSAHWKGMSLAMRWKTESLYIVLALAWLANAALRAEGPNNKTPTAPLATWTSEEAAKWAKEAATLADDAHKELSVLEMKSKAKSFKEISIKSCGSVHVKLMRIGVLADRLTARGEAAGGELRLRMQEMRQSLSELLPEIELAHSKEIERLAEPIVTEGRKFEKAGVLEKAQKALAQHKFDEADDVTWKVVSRLEGPGIWFSALSATRKAGIEPFAKLFTTAQSEILAQIRDKCKKEYLANASGVRADQIVAGLEHSAKGGESAGAALAGPKAAAGAIQEWHENQLATLHALAWNAARSDIVACEPLIKNLPMVHRDITERLAKLIVADINRVPPDKIPATYQAYAQALAPVWRQVSDEKLLAPLETAMLQLANANSNFSGQVQAYDRATADVLRWRRRIAERLADKNINGYDELPFNPLGEKVLSKPAVNGLAKLKLAMYEKKSRVHNLLRGRDGVATSSMEKDNLFYTRIPAGTDGSLIEIVDRLKHDLLVGEGQPLSLHGAAALAETTRGDIVRAGGKVTNFEIESLLHRCHDSNENDGGLVALGPFWTDTLTRPDPIEQVIVSAEVMPDWIQYRYGFTQLSAQP
jgi:hypothetical protein